MSISLESSSSSSATPVVEVVDFAVLVRPGPGLVFGFFSDHLLGVIVIVVLMSKALLIIVYLGL